MTLASQEAYALLYIVMFCGGMVYGMFKRGE
jgi:hypothetical protein